MVNFFLINYTEESLKILIVVTVDLNKPIYEEDNAKL